MLSSAAASPPASPQELASALEGAFASLDDQMAVLQILDGTAEDWPGIAACMLAVRTVAQSVVARMLADSCDALSAATKSKALSEELETVAARERTHSVSHQRLQKQANASAAELRQTQARLQAAERDLEHERSVSRNRARLRQCWRCLSMR